MTTSEDGTPVTPPSAIDSETYLAPPRPEFNESLDLWTFQDAYDYVLDSFDIKDNGTAKRRATRAVLEAYRDIIKAHAWTYLKRRGQVVTVASQATGTITYDATGGTYERQVTLSGATWPTNVRYYRFKYSGVSYKIAEYKSSTVITLTEDSHPVSDIAAGSSYKIYRCAYPLPASYRKGIQPIILNDSIWPQYVAPEQAVAMLENDQDPESDPDFYTIRGNNDSYGQLHMEFVPPPSSARTYDFLYDARMRPIKPFVREPQYSTGTVSVSGTTVTGVGTAFSTRMVGSVIRFSTSASIVPSGFVGNSTTYEPFEEQRVILAAPSATSITIDSQLDGTYSAKKFSIGDPLDLEPEVMLTPFLKLAQWKYAQYAQHKNAPKYFQDYDMELKDSAYADYRSKDVQSGSRDFVTPNTGYGWGDVEVGTA